MTLLVGGENKLVKLGKISQLEKNLFGVLIGLKIEDTFLCKTVRGNNLVGYREHFKRLIFFFFCTAVVL